MRIIIAGGGPAAVEAAVTIRQYDQISSVDIYSEENVLPYRRLLLPAVLAKTIPLERLQIHPAEFYRQHNINIHLAESVTGIDARHNTVILQSGKVKPFDRLLVATGRPARKLTAPPVVSDRIFSLHTVDDVEKIEQTLQQATSAVVIGGGVLGLECAEALLKRNLQVTVIEQNNSILRGTLDSECSAFLQKQLLLDSNLTIYTNSSLANISLHNRQLACSLNNTTRTIYTDFIISSIGLSPARDLGIELATDEFLRIRGSNNIYAAGDCAVICNQMNCYYKSACMQGRIAGENITGGMKKYNALPEECRSILNNTAFYSAGFCDEKICEAAAERSGKSLKKLFYRQNKLVGCMLIGNIQDAGELYSIILNHHFCSS